MHMILVTKNAEKLCNIHIGILKYLGIQKGYSILTGVGTPLKLSVIPDLGEGNRCDGHRTE